MVEIFCSVASMIGKALTVSLLIYFTPSLVSKLRGHNNSTPIFIINLFLGWTLLGWVAALAWSFTKDVRPLFDAERKEFFPASLCPAGHSYGPELVLRATVVFDVCIIIALGYCLPFLLSLGPCDIGDLKKRNVGNPTAQSERHPDGVVAGDDLGNDACVPGQKEVPGIPGVFNFTRAGDSCTVIYSNIRGVDFTLSTFSPGDGHAFAMTEIKKLGQRKSVVFVLVTTVNDPLAWAELRGEQVSRIAIKGDAVRIAAPLHQGFYNYTQPELSATQDELVTYRKGEGCQGDTRLVFSFDREYEEKPSKLSKHNLIPELLAKHLKSQELLRKLSRTTGISNNPEEDLDCGTAMWIGPQESSEAEDGSFGTWCRAHLCDQQALAWQTWDRGRNLAIVYKRNGIVYKEVAIETESSELPGRLLSELNRLEER